MIITTALNTERRFTFPIFLLLLFNCFILDCFIWIIYLLYILILLLLIFPFILFIIYVFDFRFKYRDKHFFLHQYLCTWHHQAFALLQIFQIIIGIISTKYAIFNNAVYFVMLNFSRKWKIKMEIRNKMLLLMASN